MYKLYFSLCFPYLFLADDCDHLGKYPVYSETHQYTNNITVWDKPWSPEIDWLDSYVNLSSQPPYVLEGLFLGYKVTKHPKYFFQSHTGCWLRFKFDIELTQSHYLEYYANGTNPMLLCTPNVPMRPDVVPKRTWIEQHDPSVSCFYYHLGILEVVYGEAHRSYIWTNERLGLSLVFSVAVLIGVTGIIGRCDTSILLVNALKNTNICRNKISEMLCVFYRKYYDPSRNLLQERATDSNQFISRQSCSSWFTRDSFIALRNSELTLRTW